MHWDVGHRAVHVGDEIRSERWIFPYPSPFVRQSQTAGLGMVGGPRWDSGTCGGGEPPWCVQEYG